jgi:hypothetical protein
MYDDFVILFSFSNVLETKDLENVSMFKEDTMNISNNKWKYSIGKV